MSAIDHASQSSTDVDLGPLIRRIGGKPLGPLGVLLLGGYLWCLLLGVVASRPNNLARFQAIFSSSETAKADRLLFGYGIAVLGLIGWGLVSLWRTVRDVWFLHARGIRHWHLGRPRILRYENVTEVAFKVSRNEDSLEQQLILRTAEAEAEPMIVRFSFRDPTSRHTNRINFNEVEAVWFHLTERIGRQMLETLQRGEPVRWTANLTLHPEGIAVDGGPAGKEIVPWDCVARTDTDQGLFRLWVTGDDQPRITVCVDLPNFFPGFYVLFHRIAPGRMSAPFPDHIKALAGFSHQPLGGPALTRRFTQTIDDHVIFDEYEDARPDSPRRTWVRQSAFAVRVVGAGILLVFAAGVIRGDISFLTGLLGLSLSVLLIVLSGPALDRFSRLKRRRAIRKELNNTRRLAEQGLGAHPFQEFEVALFEWGYRVRKNGNDWQRSWKEVEGVEWYKGYINVWVASTPVSRSSLDLYLPPRVFAHLAQAYLVYQEIESRIMNAKSASES